MHSRIWQFVYCTTVKFSPYTLLGAGGREVRDSVWGTRRNFRSAYAAPRGSRCSRGRLQCCKRSCVVMQKVSWCAQFPTVKFGSPSRENPRHWPKKWLTEMPRRTQLCEARSPIHQLATVMPLHASHTSASPVPCSRQAQELQERVTLARTRRWAGGRGERRASKAAAQRHRGHAALRLAPQCLPVRPAAWRPAPLAGRPPRTPRRMR